MSSNPWPGYAAVLLALSIAGGCTGDARSTTTPRTADEQMLLSAAADRAIGKLDARKLAGRKVYVDTALLESIDRGYVVSSFRELVARCGADLVDRIEDSEVVFEVRAGALATYDKSYTLWIPTLFIVGLVAPEGEQVEAPEFLTIGYVQHRGWARMQCFAYERRTGAFVFGWRDGWGRGHKAFFEDIYPKADLKESLSERVE